MRVAWFFEASSNPPVGDLKFTLTEADFHEKKLADDIGLKWKDLARALGFNQAFVDVTETEKNHCARECCIEVLVRWLRREGKDATAEKLLEALVKTGVENVADRFLCKPNDTNKVIRPNIQGILHGGARYEFYFQVAQQ